jgi:hypothetical protein
MAAFRTAAPADGVRRCALRASRCGRTHGTSPYDNTARAAVVRPQLVRPGAFRFTSPSSRILRSDMTDLGRRPRSRPAVVAWCGAGHSIGRHREGSSGASSFIGHAVSTTRHGPQLSLHLASCMGRRSVPSVITLHAPARSCSVRRRDCWLIRRAGYGSTCDASVHAASCECSPTLSSPRACPRTDSTSSTTRGRLSGDVESVVVGRLRWHRATRLGEALVVREHIPPRKPATCPLAAGFLRCLVQELASL